MNLIFIYGPPAAGKLTVANEIKKHLGYRVFQNHTIVGCISDVFPFDDGDLEPVLKRLSAKYRLDIYKEAAIHNVNLITTYGGGSTKRFKFFRDVEKIVEKHGGKVFFVQLLPSNEALYRRVKSKSRKQVKIDSVSYLKKQLLEHPKFVEKLPGLEHLTIDNTRMSPRAVANQIIKYYSLR